MRKNTVERKIPSTQRDVKILIFCPTVSKKEAEKTPGILWIHGGICHRHGGNGLFLPATGSGEKVRRSGGMRQLPTVVGSALSCGPGGLSFGSLLAEESFPRVGDQRQPDYGRGRECRWWSDSCSVHVRP